MLNHWDNLDRTIERGYAGESIWDWWKLPDVKDPRYVDYARANASLGINAVSLNNVSSKPEMLLPQFIAKAAALADVFRPYGIKVYFAARFSAPEGARWPADRRSARSQGVRVVEGEGRRRSTRPFPISAASS